MTIRASTSADDGFILGLVERFSAFALPSGRDRGTVNAALRRDLERHLHERPVTSSVFVTTSPASARASCTCSWSMTSSARACCAISPTWR